jgi:hypothetical protein
VEKEEADLLQKMIAAIDERFRKMEARQIAADVFIAGLVKHGDKQGVAAYVQKTIDSEAWKESNDPQTAKLAFERLQKMLTAHSMSDDQAEE